MSDKSKSRHQKSKAPTLTPEQKAELQAALLKQQVDEKAERERVELFGKSLEKMSDRQIRGELRRLIRRERTGDRPPQPQAGLTIALGSILLTMMETTQTPENPWAKLAAYPR